MLKAILLSVVLSSGAASADSLAVRVVEDHSERPVSRAEVRIRGTDGQAPIAVLETSSEGGVRMGGLKSGEYVLDISKPFYGGAHIRMVARADSGDNAIQLLVRLPRYGAISGHIFDLTARPVSSARIVVLSAPQPSAPAHIAGQTEGGSQGEYRIYGLPPGRYVAALIRAGEGAALLRGVLFYPNNARPRAFSVSGGEEYDGVDFTVGGNGYSISGKLNGALTGLVQMSLVSASHPEVRVANMPTSQNTGAAFRLENILPGSYDLLASGFATPGSARSAGRLHIEVTGQNVEGIAMPIDQSRSAGFAMRPVGGAPCGQDAAVTLTPVEDWLPGAPLTAPIHAQKPEIVNNLLPGHYQVTAASGNGACHWAAEGTLDLTEDGHSEPLAVMLAQSGSIHGNLTRKDCVAVLAAPDAPAIQVVFPASDGTFAFENLAPGTYYVMAQPATGPGQRWSSDPARLPAPIRVSAGSITTIELRAPVAAN